MPNMQSETQTMHGLVAAVARDRGHAFSKPLADGIRLLEGLGIEGDAHCGVTVKHRSRVAADPSQPNLRQVHLIHAELFEELAGKGFVVAPGQLGENIATRGLDLLGLPVAARLHIGPTAVVEITGLRNPCAQIDRFQNGLLAAVLDRDADGEVVRKAGVMGIVVAGGLVAPGDPIRAVLPEGRHRPLERV
jgi:MOSC domain-containing protein YiiM